jgi:glyoxylase-like metal-dependent hydrolase (beta-lactamase superfamily II)
MIFPNLLRRWRRPAPQCQVGDSLREPVHLADSLLDALAIAPVKTVRLVVAEAAKHRRGISLETQYGKVSLKSIMDILGLHAILAADRDPLLRVAGMDEEATATLQEMTRFLSSDTRFSAILADAGTALDTCRATSARLSEHARILNIAYRLNPNLVLFTGHIMGNLLVDAGYSQTAHILRRLVAAQSSGPVRWVVSTHGQGGQVVGKRQFPEAIGMVNWENLEQHAANNPWLAPEASPDPCGKSYFFWFEEWIVRIIACPNPRKQPDLLVHIPADNLLCLGYLLVPTSFPVIADTVSEYLAFLDQIIARFPDETIFVGGYGRPVNKTELVAYQHMLATTCAAVRAQFDAGKTVAELTRGDGFLGEYQAQYGQSLPLPDPNRWIKAIYRSYYQS